MEEIKNTNTENNGIGGIPVRKRLRWNNRAIHRDLAYFYFGLILSFSLSGFVLNHRTDWHLDQYTVSSRQIRIDLGQSPVGSGQLAARESAPGEQPETASGGRKGRGPGHRHGGQGLNGTRNEGGGVMIPESFARDFARQFGITDSLRRQFIQRGIIRLNFVNHSAEINMRTGWGQITEFRKTPVISQMVQLHRSNSPAWVCFSDTFAISMIIIAITGVLLPKGRNSFARRGWVFTAAGLIIPLAILFIIL
ncbi:MAG TPA: PepSY-associated TM helix domain-containing protein [Bacteroidales bacterium]|nr:PepSY-associated TM helix domain-containing protein [Bacteroidales bacterium]HPS62621.1 PepSY-associated TM helix domain-containing protein [Bacteroidales bacterium]